MKKLVRICLLCCVCASFVRAAEKPQVVFQIGIHDKNYHEFAIAGDYPRYLKQFPHDVNYVVGQSDPARDWSFIHPGPHDRWAGVKPHAFLINFQSPQPLSGFYRLTIDLVSGGSVPSLMAIDVNGEKYELKIPEGGNSAVLKDPSAGTNCSMQCVIPSSVLRAGANTIALTILDGTWALYDDIRLESGAPAPEGRLEMKAEPLPFFKRAPGGLQRAVRLSLTNPEDPAPAELIWKSKTLSGSQKFDLHFGVNSLLILVPDVDCVAMTLRTPQHEVKLPVLLPPAKKWQVFIIPTAHTDVGYTDLQDKVKVRHADNGLRALGMCDEMPSFEWYWETYWQISALLELHPEQAEAVFARLRQKRMGLSGEYANLLTGLCSSEALNRLTLDSCNLGRRAGCEVNAVTLDDVPSAIGSLPMVLANSGIKYFVEGANVDRAPYAGSVPNPFYWEGADGSRVFTYISSAPGYGVGNRLLPSMEKAHVLLPPFLARFETASYPYDAVLINGAFGDNAELQATVPKVVEEWNAQWEFPKLRLAMPEDYFKYIEKNFPNSIPVLKADFGSWWEDGAGSSALETTLSRRAEERIVTAEMLHSLAAILTGATYPKTNFDEAWHNILLYNEHTWGAAGSIRTPNAEQTIKQWEVKSAFAHDADAQSRDLVNSGMAKLAQMVPASDLIVFNQLAWPRSAVVKTETSGAVQEMETKQVSPSQPLPEGGSCFIANALPSIGYRSYREVALSQPAPDAARISNNCQEMENEFYRVTLNPKTGGIQSIFDKQIGRELVDTNSEFDLGELVYVAGGEGTSAIHSNATNSPPKFEYSWQSGTGIKSIVGPVFGELTSEATAENFPKITMRVRLYKTVKQLDLVYELEKTETTRKEAVYLAFPFALDERRCGLWFEYPDAITEPLKDQHSSACRDWYSVQRWLAVSDGDHTVELSPPDAPLFTFGHMSASTWPRELSLRGGHVFAYLMNNYWHTNYKAKQGGRFAFRYSLASSAGSFSKSNAVVSGWNMFCEPVAARGQGQHQPLISSAAKSLVGIEPMGMPITAIKQAEDKDGFVFRLCDFAGAGGNVTLALPKAAGQLFHCNLVETDMQPLQSSGETVIAPVKPFAPLTLKAQFKP